MTKLHLPRRTSLQFTLGSSLFALFACGSLPFATGSLDGDADSESEEETEEANWDVNHPPGEAREISIDVTEGTWLSLDVSPDGKEIAFDLLGDIYALPIEGGKARALTSGIAWDMQPRFSPDGESIAFTSDREGGDNLWVMDRDGGNAEALTTEDFRLMNSPAWTPDGRAVVGHKHFSSRRSIGAGEIWMVHRSGAKGLQMTVKRNEQKDLGEPVFSPDGRYLYYSHDSTPGDTFEYSKDSTGQIYQIDRLDTETGEIRAIVTGPGGACRPTPSPDGKSLAFVRRLDFVSTLFVLDLASGEARPIYGPLERDMQETWAIHGVYPNMAWLPDSTELVLYAKGKLRRVNVADGSSAQIPFHVNDTREIREAVRFPVAVAPTEFDVKCLRHVSVAPDGSRVVYQTLGHLWTRALPDGTPTRLSADNDHFEFFPAFSRDGEKIAFVTWDDEELGAVWVMNADGTNLTRVTTEPGHYITPVFSPDGTELVYHRVGGGYITSPLWSYETGIYRVSTDGGTPELITRDGSEPQFGADPERLFVVRNEYQPDADRHTLVSIQLTDRKEVVHFASANAVEWEISPDGKWLAFSERYKASIVPVLNTGRTVDINPTSDALPVAIVSKDAGENLQFSGDSSRIFWSLGPVLYERELTDAFAFLEGAPDELPEPVATGRNIAFTHPTIESIGTYALTGARLITMVGEEVIESGTIVVRDNRIAAVGPADTIALEPGVPSIDCSGLTIMPGLIDVHAHGGQAMNDLTPQANWIHHGNLAFGVTTIHDPSNNTNSIFAAAELAKAGLILSPRTYSTGTILYGAQGSFKAEVDSLDDALAHLRRLKAVGAISVKSYNQPRRDQRQQVLEAARQLEIMVVPEGGSLFEHNMTMVIDGHTGIEHSLPVEAIYDDVKQLWGSTGVGYTPTLVVGYGGIWGENYWYEHLDVWRHERLRNFVPRSIIEPRSRRRPKAPEEDYNHLRSSCITKALIDAGGKVQLGAHGQLAGFAAHWEIWMFAQGGMTELEALRSATLSGAEYIGLDADLGSIENGKLADLMVLEANPLENIRNTDSARFTILGGRVLDSRTMQTIDPATMNRGEQPSYFWQGLESGIGVENPVSCSGCLGSH